MGKSLFMKSGWITANAPLRNGIGRYIPQLARVTIKFCKSSGSSNGVRQFIQQDVVQLAKKNPSFVVYLKPRRFRSPVLVAEYLNGERHWQSLNNMMLMRLEAGLFITEPTVEQSLWPRKK